jgi:hypothetical protein
VTATCGDARAAARAQQKIKKQCEVEGVAVGGVRDADVEGFAEVGAELDGGGWVVGALETAVWVGVSDGLAEVGAAELALGGGERLAVPKFTVDTLGAALVAGAAEVRVAATGAGPWVPPPPNMRNPTTAMPAHPPVTMSPTPRRRCPRRPLWCSPPALYEEPDSVLGKLTVSGPESPSAASPPLSLPLPPPTPTAPTPALPPMPIPMPTPPPTAPASVEPLPPPLPSASAAYPPTAVLSAV